MEIKLEDKLGYSFNNKDLLGLALIHKSYNNIENNERLEFLGDAILNAVISEYLYLRFDSENEGLLTRMRSYFVKAEMLTNKAEELGLTEYIKMSKGTANLDKKRKNSILEGVFEAILGSVFLDGGWEKVKNLILDVFDDEFNSISADMEFRDSKSELQELFQSMKVSPPEYSLKNTKNGFECTLSFDNKEFISEGRSKQISESRVAEAVLQYVKASND